MTSRVTNEIKNMKPETVTALQQLVHALRDSISYHEEAANQLNDEHVKNTLLRIAKDRQVICDSIGGYIEMTDEKPVEDGTWLGSLRTIWTSMRAALNAGDATVVLIEAERAEDVIVNQFKQTLPQIAGVPINDKLLVHYQQVKAGHDHVLALRNAYQNA